ncbi:hypothetical protein [Cohnella thermotolerans]|uniref:hypothetical protein n=1 Tax=Cohnella thermotolerans TaxID=329858 RepID=UPI0012EBBFEB|nr:hypothetical protein [Cohnella thermotolerans]
MSTANGGPGSGFNADMVDGKHSSDFAPVASPNFSGTVTMTGDIIMAQTNLWNAGNVSAINLLPDSGRFMGNDQEPLAQASNAPFTAPSTFAPYNGGTIASGGKFIHDNTDFGGTRGNMTSDVISLLSAMPSNPSRRYGVEFYIATITQGTGTNVPHPTVSSAYLLTSNNGFSMGGSGKYVTWSFWIRLKSGTNVIIDKKLKLYKNGVEMSSYVTLGPSDGWVHIQTTSDVSIGYDNAAPAIFAKAGDVVQLALPVVSLGGTGVGIHTSPIPRASLGYVAAPLASPALTGTPTAPTATVGTNTTQIATTAFTVQEIISRSRANILATPPAESDPITVYPSGLSMTFVGAGSGWTPNGGYGTVITYNVSDGRSFQWFMTHGSGADKSSSWIRVYYTGWSAWAKMITDVDYTAADVLAKIKTVHGPGSGLNADMVDGKHASDFAGKAASVSEFNVSAADTSTTALSYVTTAAGNYQVLVYLRVTATTTVTLWVTYTDVSGAQQTNLVTNQSFTAGSYSLLPLFINNTSGTGINVRISCSNANTVKVSASIVGV